MDDEKDGFFIEDIIGNLKKSQRKKRNSKDKGKRGERDLCTLLSQRFPGKEGFARVVGSGMLGHRAALSEQAKEFLTGDIVCPEGFRFSIECKYGYAGVDLSTAFEDGHKTLDTFLLQADKDAGRVGKRPLVCWKKERQHFLAFVEDLNNHDDEFEFLMKYKKWKIVSLQKLFKIMPDDFFFG
jgi:Holliday junction resolvase